MLPIYLGYKKLAVYQKARLLVLLAYKITAGFPKTETFTLVPQMRRSAVSVLANIAEGYSKESSAEFARFLTIAIGSITELEVYVDLCVDLEFINKSDYREMAALLLEAKKLLYSTRKTIKGKVYKPR